MKQWLSSKLQKGKIFCILFLFVQIISVSCILGNSKIILNLLDSVWNYLNNSQLVSSIIGAGFGGWIALKIANQQSEDQKQLLMQEIDESRKQRNKEIEQQQTFYMWQDENERERIYLQLVLERLENAYEILSKLCFAPDIIGRKIVPAFAQYLPSNNPEDEISDYEFRETLLKIQHQVLDPEFEQQSQLLFQLKSLLVLHDHIEIQTLLLKLMTEFKTFEETYEELCKCNSIQECLQISSSYSKYQTLTAAVDQLMREIAIYLGELASQLISAERQKRFKEEVEKSVYEEKINITKL
ncbi:TPA: hypothetical protein ACGO9B_001123 [Streptococcus suis]|nr:hypothetical protein [Streptococcus suis]NQH97432.1 hypothetical protein [Streptococcus suis]